MAVADCLRVLQCLISKTFVQQHTLGHVDLALHGTIRHPLISQGLSSQCAVNGVAFLGNRSTEEGVLAAADDLFAHCL